MVKENVLQFIERFQMALEEQHVHIQKIVLYGSWANGRAHEESDTDVVVISDSFKGKDYWDRIDLLSRAIYKIFVPIEAVAMTQEEWDNNSSRVCEYAKNGEVVFSS